MKTQATNQDVSDFRDLVKALINETNEVIAVEKHFGGEEVSPEEAASQAVANLSEILHSFAYCMIVGHDFEDGTCTRCFTLEPEEN